MLKNVMKTLILILITFSVNFAFAQTQVLKIGVVDIEVIVREMPEAIEANNKLAAMSKNYQDTLLNMQKELEDRLQKYQKQKAMMPLEQQQKEEEALNALNGQLFQYREQISGPRGYLAQIQEQLLDPIRKKVRSAIEKVAKEEKMNFVLDKAGTTLLYSEGRFDITYRVLDLLKRGNTK